MKTRKLSFAILITLIVFVITSCELDPIENNTGESILPERFKVDIPGSLSKNDQKSSFHKSLKADNDTLDGNEIYEHLGNFIAIGEAGADIVQSIIWSISVHKVDRVIELTYISDEDNRTKSLVVDSNVVFQSRTWEYQLTITDVLNEGNADGGIGMQVFWNKSPIEGIALIKPSNMNIRDNENVGAMFSIEYSEKGMGEYESYMIIGIADLPLPNATLFPYAMNSLKMFVGKKGDIVDVYGNSNHPNAKFFTDKTGFNWAFVASGSENEDIGVAEVSLPQSTLNTTDRNIILKDYSVKNVLTNEINDWFLTTYGVRPNADDLSGLLTNADAPGYFNNGGFIQGGTAPNDNYSTIEGRLELLSPYNPSTVTNLEISFK